MNGIDISADGTVGWAVRELPWVRDAVRSMAPDHRRARRIVRITEFAWAIFMLATAVAVSVYFVNGGPR